MDGIEKSEESTTTAAFPDRNIGSELNLQPYDGEGVAEFAEIRVAGDQRGFVLDG
jgi:hypothetical protein